MSGRVLSSKCGAHIRTVEIATKQQIRDLIDWAFQTIRYTLTMAFLEQQRAPPAKSPDFTKRSETITQELTAKARTIVSASNPTAPMDIVLIGLVLDWSAA